jgi:hypothetical protein
MYFKIKKEFKITFKEALEFLAKGNYICFEIYDPQVNETSEEVYRLSEDCKNLQVLYNFNNQFIDTWELPNYEEMTIYKCNVIFKT